MLKNNKIFGVFFLVLFLFSSKSAFAFESYEDKIVNKIEVIVEGEDQSTFDSKSILSKLQTQKGDRFSQLIFDSDLKILSEDFDRIEPEIKIDNEELKIVIKVWPKPIINEIIFKGNKNLRTKTLRKKIDINDGSVFTRTKFSKELNNVKEYYLKKGYFESQITYHIEKLEKNPNSINIIVEIKEGKSGKIRKIKFVGFTKAEVSELEEKLYIKKYSPYTGWLTGKGVFNKDALEQDKMSIIDYLHNKGYADATVDVLIEDSYKRNRIVIEFSAYKGSIYKIGKVNIQGNILFTTKEVDEKLNLKKGEIYSPERIREAVQSVSDLYGKKGYIDVDVNYDSKLDEDKPIYNLEFFIDEGDKYKIGLIKIFGNAHTNSNVILRESLLVPGELFDSRKLRATKQRLENIGYFNSVNVYAVKSTEDLNLGDNYRDVYIEVEEKSTGSASIFAGFSSKDDFSAGLDITETNFNYKGFSKLFSEGPGALRGGGEFLRLKGAWGLKQRNYLLSWMTPYLRDTLWRFGFDVSYTVSKLLSKNIDVRTYGGSIFASYPVTRYLTYGARYRLRHENSDIKDVKDTDPIEKREQVNKIEESKGLLSAVSNSIVYDSTNDAYKPSKGYRSSLDAEYSGVGGKFQFVKASYLNKFFYPLWRKGTFKLKGDFKFIFPLFKTHYDSVPLAERFFLGGETTVRGYKPFIIGPRIKDTKTEPAGGISSTLLSGEVSQQLAKLLEAFVFFDAGNVDKNQLHISKLRCSTGVGIRLEVMNRVPITIGYGLCINPQHKKDRQGYFFAMGGQF